MMVAKPLIQQANRQLNPGLKCASGDVAIGHGAVADAGYRHITHSPARDAIYRQSA